MAWRASRVGIALGLFGGFLLPLVLPVREAWLAGAVALGCSVLALLCIGLAQSRGTSLPDPAMDVGAALEKVGAADQVAHGLARAASVLASLYAGLLLGGLVT